MKSMMKAIGLSILCLAWLPLAGAGLAVAQDYPTKAVHWIVPYPPGGGTDIAARTGTMASERLGQQFIIENKPRRQQHRHRRRDPRGTRRLHLRADQL